MQTFLIHKMIFCPSSLACILFPSSSACIFFPSSLACFCNSSCHSRQHCFCNLHYFTWKWLICIRFWFAGKLPFTQIIFETWIKVIIVSGAAPGDTSSASKFITVSGTAPGDTSSAKSCVTEWRKIRDLKWRKGVVEIQVASHNSFIIL